MSKAVVHFFEYKTNVKRRWIGLTLIDLLARDFRTRSTEYYREAIETGVITVNRSAVNETYVVKDGDIIYHTVHMHEPMPPKIQIVREEKDYVVVNKPSGVPVHPTGGYYYYTVTKALLPDAKVGCVNRLDLPVSGILILVHSNHTAVHDAITYARKFYIAKVKGEFPDCVTVDEPISTRDGHTRHVDASGQPSKTIFRRIECKDGYSLVECQPVTGRTHQIRVHLKHIGYPILNDMMYGGGERENRQEEKRTLGCGTDISEFVEKEKYKCIVKYCEGEKNKSFRMRDSFICLHAWRYEFNGNVYETEWPSWAVL